MPFPEPGGSNLVTYRVDDIVKDAAGEPVLDAAGHQQYTYHGYIREFHLGVATIEAQLQQMYVNGQRRLGLAVPYFAGGDTFALDATEGVMAPQDAANLAALVRMARSIGFVEYLVEMIPEWECAYTNWQDPNVVGPGNTRAWQPLIYDKCLRFTLAVDAVVGAACSAPIDGQPPALYRMNLCGECANVQFGSRLWIDWCAMKGGHAGSVGFSMVQTKDAIADIPLMYTNGIMPEVWAVSAYNNTPVEMSWSAWKALIESKYWQGIIIQESLANNPEADAIFAADSSDVFYRLVWPVGSNDPGAPPILTTEQTFPAAT